MSGMDEAGLRRFYGSLQGRIVRQLISTRLEAFVGLGHLPPGEVRVAVGIGYSQPYLGLLEAGGEQTASHVIGFSLADRLAEEDETPPLAGLYHPTGPAHPDQRGQPYDAAGNTKAGALAATGPKNRQGRLARIDALNLPLLDSSVQLVLLVHGLERAASSEGLLDECWRVLAGQGRLVIVVPHRGSIWSQRDHTPFGHGRPFSMGQLSKLLSSHGFVLTRSAGALVLPPVVGSAYPKLAMMLEKPMQHLARPLGGVLIVEATKMLYSIKGKRQPSRRLVVRPARPLAT